MTYLLLVGAVLLSIVFRVLALKQVKTTEITAKEKRQKYILFNLGFYISIALAFYLVYTIT